MSDTLEAADQAEKRKITNAYKVFFFLSLRASDMMLRVVLISQSTANFSDVTV